GQPHAATRAEGTVVEPERAGAGVRDLGGPRGHGPGYQHRLGPGDGRLPAGDAGQVGSEILDVVETDRGHHAHFGVDDVGGVEPAAATNPDDGGVDGPVGEEGEGAGR